MLTAMLLKGETKGLAAYHCRGENYYFKQATKIEEEILAKTGEFPQRDEALEYVTVHGLLSSKMGFKAGERISEGEFLNLLDGKDKAGELVTRRKKVKGIDLTFSAPKAVSVLGLVMDKNPEIIRAHDAAVQEVMADIEKFYTVARPDPRRQVTTGKMCWAAVRDGFSREHDPHLHTHVVVMNLTELDGKVMGLWTRKILQREFNQLFGAIYRQKLGHKLTALGYKVEYVKNGEWRLAKVSKELEAEFSKRREQIEEEKEAGRRDMDAWRKSRAEKSPAVNKAEILKDWARRLGKYVVDEVVNAKNIVLERISWAEQAEFSVEASQERKGLRGTGIESVDWQLAARRATERKATASKLEMAVEYVKECMRNNRFEDINYKAIMNSLNNQVQIGRILAGQESYAQHYTTIKMVLTERGVEALGDVYVSGFNYSLGKRDAAKYLKDLNEFNQRRGRRALSDIQGRAVYELLISNRFIDVVQGDAGAGKTTSLKAVAESYRQRGLDVIGLAMQGVAAKKLSEEAEIPGMTLKAYLARKNPKERKVIIFDEASMLDTRNAAELLERARENGDKVILVGDTNQLQSIAAGNVFARFVEQYSRPIGPEGEFKLVVMNENFRQRNQVLREAVTLAKAGRMSQSLQLLEKDGRVFEIPTEGARRATVAAQYTKDTLIIAGSAAARDDINGLVRAGLQKQGQLQGAKEYVMARPDEDGIEQPRRIELAPGEVICFTKNEYKEYDIRNGDKGQVLECGEGRLKIKTPDNRVLDIDVKKYKGIDYGYALTTYKSQGQTYDRVVVESDTNVPDLADMRNQYVNITRAREDIRVYTDNFEELQVLADVKTHAKDTHGFTTSTDRLLATEAEIQRDVVAATNLVKTQQPHGWGNQLER